MNKIIGSLLVILVSTSSFAAVGKICFGSSKSDETNGVVLSLGVDQEEISITKVKQGTSTQTFVDDYYNEGIYQSNNSVIKGHDGKVYMTYQGEDSDYGDTILVDSKLLKKGTVGLLQIRSRGESFNNYVFVCKDSKI